MRPDEFQNRVLDWSRQNGRKDLPWQRNITPYRVWISEIMLQQTQVATVVPYFNRFLQHYPSVTDLADAPLDSVLHDWAGLGYYARARNMHRSAQIIAKLDEFPSTLDQLIELPGIGRSTAGAILSIGFGRSAPILDGNVKRILTRFHGIEAWSGHSRVLQELWSLSQRYTPQHDCADYTQAIMDLGALICTRNKPNCCVCPVSNQCNAYLTERTDRIPQPRPTKQLTKRECFMLLLHTPEPRFYLEKRPPIGVWGGLWACPEFACKQSVVDWCESSSIAPDTLQWHPTLRHSFTHFHLDYTPVSALLAEPLGRLSEDQQSIWYNPSSEQSCGMPTPINRLLNRMMQNEYSESPN